MTDSCPTGNELPAVKTTIVGGRPPGCGKDIGGVPRGVEVLLKKAAVDGAFRRLLLDRRDAAAQTIGLELSPTEALMLRAASRAQLEGIIARTRVEPSRRAAFLGKAAGVMLAALGAVGGTTPSPAQTVPQINKGLSVQAQPAPPVPVGSVVNHGISPVAPTSQPASQPASSPASTPASQPAKTDRAHALKLIEQLDHKDFKQREAAQKELEAMMPGVAPILREFLARADIAPEQELRLKKALGAGEPKATPPPPSGGRIEMLGLRPAQPMIVDGLQPDIPGE